MTTWRYVQPGSNQVAVCLMDADNARRLWLVPLDLVYLDHEGFHVRLHQQPMNMIARWRWRRNV